MKKKIFLALAFCLFMGSVSAQTMKDIFPDEKLAQCVLKEYNEVNGENTISDSDEVIEENLKKITSLECVNAGVKNSTGIEKLEGLTNLSLPSNQLTSIELSRNTALKSLVLYNNQLTSVDLSKNTTLEYLVLYNNQLTSIDLSKNTVLKYLLLNNNQLTSIDLSKNKELTDLSLENNQLTGIDLSHNTALEHLFLNNNSFLNEVKINGVGNDISLSDYVNLIDKYGVEYKIDDESIAKYDVNTGKIIGLKEGTTTAKLTINGTYNESNVEIAPVEFESTITVINNTSGNGGSGIIDDGNTTSGTTTNPGTGVKVFAFVDCLVIIGAISCYIVVRRKNKYKKI